MGTKILVVDDSAFTRHIVKNALIDRGFREVIEAENGEEGLRKYETEKPDVVLLDVIMPGLDGTGMLKRVMNMDKNAKVIMLSAVGQEKTRELCNKFGVAGYVIKPFDEKQLVDTVEKTLYAKEKEETLTKLTRPEEDALREVGYRGALRAAEALSMMIGQTVSVKLLAARMTTLGTLPGLVGDRETMVSGVYLPMTGDVSGSLLMVFPQQSAFSLVDILLKKKLGTTKELDEMDKSALSEAANILAGNCLTALAHTLRVHLVEHVPDFAYDMVGALIDNVAVAFGQKAERALTIQVELNTATKVNMLLYFFLLFPLKEAHVMLRALRAKVGT